jgi:hypothetical protein
MVTRTQGRSRVFDDARDRISVMPGQPEAHRDLRVEVGPQLVRKKTRATIGT